MGDDLPSLEDLRRQALAELAPLIPSAAALIGRSLNGAMRRGDGARLASARYVLDSFKGLPSSRLEVSGKLDLAALVLAAGKPAEPAHQVEPAAPVVALPAPEPEPEPAARPPVIRRAAR